MSRTRRIYNKPNRIFGVWVPMIGWVCHWHPYNQWGSVKALDYCHEAKYFRKCRRLQQKTELHRELKMLGI